MLASDLVTITKSALPLAIALAKVAFEKKVLEISISKLSDKTIKRMKNPERNG
ncbi:hypothetical protein TUM4445_23600 [Shewanella sp. MBTL60-112-B2]|nr:hypothetical protein TUM4444_26230 [Shewanella sp. MBTL60-112-B1]GIU34702.1 hypothetical protein TUM4445_23600 [Shewanella sp. MBTL60-112-B2]